MRILITEPTDFPPGARALLEQVGDVVAGPFTRPELLAAVHDADALVVRFAHRIDAGIIAAAPRLRAIASASTGVDHIDTTACKLRDIEIVSLMGETEFLRTIPATAELCFGLIIAITRNVVGAALSTRRGEWQRDRFRGRNLKGRTLGLIGCGRIGEMVARYAIAFAMDVVAHDPGRAVLPEGVRRADSLRDLMRQSDIVSVHVPLAAATRGLVDAGMLAAMPAGGYLVNTARGAIVDEAALCAALASGHLAGAALDVVAIEPREGTALDGPIHAFAARNDNLLLTPHIGGATFDSMAAAETFAVEKLAKRLSRKS